jgi:hypothetical protein
MGITQQSAAARLIQPGVVDNTAARPASPFEGQCIFQKDTDQLLVWNGTAWVIPNAPAQNPTGLELVSTTTVSSGSSVTVSNVFSSTYDCYKIIMSGGATTGNGTLGFQFSGITSGYYIGIIYWAFSNGTGTPNIYSAANQSNWQEVGSTSTNGIALNMDVINPNLAKWKQYSCASPNMNTSGSFVVTNGICASTTQATGFVLSHGSTFTSGTISVYGYRK